MDLTTQLQSLLPNLYQNNSCDHDLTHILRVTKNAEYIGQKEKANLAILLPAAMLHDIALKQNTLPQINDKHAILGAQKAQEILQKLTSDTNLINQIASTIRQHSLDNPTNEPRTLEGDCLFDADKLDAITPCGLARYFQEQALEKNLNVLTVAKKSEQFLTKIEFRTKTGKILGKDRSQVINFAKAVILSSQI
jgi:uncharacterized protein